MIASAHLAAGLVIGTAASHFMRWRPGSVVASFAAGVLLHLAMDHVPHADYNGIVGSPLRVIVALESIATFAIAFLILRRRVSPGWMAPTIAGLLGSSLPDVKFVAPLLLPDEYARRATDIGERLHYAIHASPTSLAFGMTTQLVATVVLLAMLAAFPRKMGSDPD